MRNMQFALSTLVITLVIALNSEARAWEARYGAVAPRLNEFSQSLTTPPSSRSAPQYQSAKPVTLKYPSDVGVSLGTSWDLYLNKKVNSTCIQFEAQKDDYQDASLNLREASDEETRDSTLNTTFGISGGGSFAGFGGSASVDITSNSFSHMYSKDLLLVAHATATKGTLFATAKAVKADDDPEKKTGQHALVKADGAAGKPKGAPLGYHAITLLEGMADLWGRNKQEFRKLCGDGFVASISYGADLYALLTFHEVDQKTRNSLSTAAKASGSFGVFNASTSASMSLGLDTEAIKKLLTIQFVQQGGEIASLPINLDTLRKKIENFAQEAWKGPKPTFIVVFPYSELTELKDRSTSRNTTLEAAIRYQRRLQGVHAELQDMIVDFFRDKTIKADDAYYFSHTHAMRAEDLQEQREELEREIDRVGLLIDSLSKCPDECDEATTDKIKTLVLNVDRKPLEARIAGNLRGVDPAQDAASKPDTSAEEFDDLKFWLKLPLPTNSLSQDDKNFIKDTHQSLPNRQWRFARAIYRHWIERNDNVRCPLFSECLNSTQKHDYFDAIMETMYQETPPALVRDIPIEPKSPNKRRFEIAPCTAVRIVNTRDAAAPNWYDLVPVNDPNETFRISRQPGHASANRTIPSSQKPRIFEITAWFGMFRAPMVNNSSRQTPLQLEWRFWDTGASFDGRNVVVYLQAIPEPGGGCDLANDWATSRRRQAN